MALERVQKIIAASGYCSRRKAEELIENGNVTVNHKLITIGDKADIAKDTIEIDGNIIKKEEPIYYLLNKPKGFITTSSDMYEREIVTELVPKTPRVFPVGRLDRDTEGLLIMTNDGEFGNKVMHPRNEVDKTYVAILDKEFDTKDFEILRSGVIVEGKKIHASIRLLGPRTVSITLHVGVNKVVKRLMKALGYYVKKLTRTHIGSLTTKIPLGRYIELTEEDRKLIFIKRKVKVTKPKSGFKKPAINQREKYSEKPKRLGFNKEDKPYYNGNRGEKRPRNNFRSDSSEKPQRSNFNRDDKPRYNDKEDKPYYNGNRGENRPRNNFRSDSSDRPQRSNYNRDNKPRYNNNKPNSFEGFRSQNSDRPQRSGYNSDRPQRSGYNSDRPQRSSYNSDRPQRSGYNSDRPQRSSYNSDRPQRSGFKKDDDKPNYNKERQKFHSNKARSSDHKKPSHHRR